MAALRLVNNTGLKSEKNLCYVNTELQLLYSTPDVRHFFASKAYRGNFLERLPVCDELSRIFRTEGRFQSSAAELRRLIGHFYNREDICNGEQQDLEEFHTLLLDVIENELESVGCENSRFGNKFRGKEQTRRKFLNSTDGCCNQGHMSRTEEEGFRVIKIDVPETNIVMSLNNIVSNHFSETTATFSMKCSECCKHMSNCPLTGKCKLREASSQKCLVTTPTILYIQLLRFDDFQGLKIDTKVTPENILVLPNQDKYRLVSIGNHLGSFINNGHYQALLKVGSNWIKADDSSIMKTNLTSEITGENYIFVYRKFSTAAQFVASNHWQEVFEDQPVPPGLHIQLNTRTGKKCAKLLEDPVDIIEENPKKKEHKNNSNGKEIQGKVYEYGATEKYPEQNLYQKEEKSNHQTSKSTEKFKGCRNDFPNIDHHIKKSFNCQNHYGIDGVMEMCPSSQEKKDSSTDKLPMERKGVSQEMPKATKLDMPALSCLDSTNWLNDEVINQYLKLVTELDEEVFIFTSFFHTAFRDGGFKRVKSYYRKHELLQYRELYIPVHKDNHWFLITFNGEELVTYDPFNYPQCSALERQKNLDKNKKCHLNILSQLEKKYFKPLFELKKKQFKPLLLQVKVPPEIPAQNNSWDCGVFLTEFVKYLLMKKEFDFDSNTMKIIRKTMKTELENGQLRTAIHEAKNQPEKGSCRSNESIESSNPGLGLLSKPSNRDTKRQNKAAEKNITHARREEKIKSPCLQCGKTVANIILHLKRSAPCRNSYDMDTMIKDQKNTARLKLNAKLRLIRANQRAEDNVLFKEKVTTQKRLNREKQRAEDDELYRENQKKSKEDYRKEVKLRFSRLDRLKKFKHAVKFGAIFICSCCNQRLFENGVSVITDKMKELVETKKSGLYHEAVEETMLTINGKIACYICHTCKRTLVKGKVPSMSVCNGLLLRKIKDPDLKLSEIESNLIAQNIIFQKIFLLPKSRMSAVKDRLVNVPVGPSDVINTIRNIPRTPKEAGLIQVKLKRKLSFKNVHKQEYIDPKKIFKMLDHLRKAGHPYYQFYDDYSVYKKRCREETYGSVLNELKSHLVNVKFIHDKGTQQIMELKNEKVTTNDEFMDFTEDIEMNEEEHYIKNDPIRKFQFDHNVSTCLTNKFPEMLANDDGEEIQENEDFSFAPGEGKSPSNILMERDWDIKAWPSLHPDGKFGLHHKRKVKLTDQNYFVQRVRNADRRFEENPGYVFAATSYVEKKRLQNNANISFLRGRKNQNEDGDTFYSLNDPYTVFDNIKNTPKYWQKYKYEMIARLENLGPFQWFFTLSCADKNWDENFSSLIRERDIEIEYEVSETTGSDDTFVIFLQDGLKKKVSLRKYLEDEVDESHHELIRTNVLNATRNFQRRVDAFIKEIIFGSNNPMKIKHLSYKVEFQGRGAGHIHGVLWTNLSLFEPTPDGEEAEFQYLTSAFKKLRDDEDLKPEEVTDLENFVDKFVTCSLNPDKLNKLVSNGWDLAKLAKEVQTHSHTRTCHKYDESCRFRKPTFPMMETTLFTSKPKSDDTEEIEAGANPGLLIRVKELLDDTETIKRIVDKYDKANESEDEFIENRRLRIKELLEIAGASYEEYVQAIRCSIKKGHCILLARDIDEGYINAFNPEWLEAWGGNVDLQPCFDYFAVITYITDYLTKDDSGVTAILREVMKSTEKEETKERMQMLINTFLTHRQMGQAEAYYKLIPSLRMKFSTVRAVFVPNDKKELRSRFLLKIEEKEETYDKVAFNVQGRDGLFMEKSDLIEKFIRRPGPKNPNTKFKEADEDTENLCLVQFAKMLETTQRKPSDEDDLPVDIDEMEIDKDDLKFHYVMEADGDKPKTPIPDFIKLLPKYPGENNIMRKRRFPAAVRFHKKRQDIDPHKFFLSELMLYYPFRDEKLDLHSDNEELCARLYQQEFEKIRKVKQQVMEHLDDVVEARYMVEEYLKNQSKNEELGVELDPEKEQEIDDCMMDEKENHPEFEHLDPAEFDDQNKTVQKERVFKPIDVGDIEDLKLQTKSLDRYQKYIVEIAIRFCRAIVKALKPKNRRPTPPILMVHGGAGSGKSTVINTLARWAHHILQKPGDDPDCPYVIISAYTGSAACNVNGQTLHSLFSFNFGNEFLTLSDKSRDTKRKTFINLAILIIDEISLVDADMLYKIELRLKEVKQSDKPFGGVALLCFGDLLQIKPVKGRYIFEEPKCDSFKLANSIQPHWNRFKVVNLEENHRQGEDKTYAEILNRIRTGDHSEEDIHQLEKRVRPKNHPDLKDDDTLYLFGKNKPVDEMNTRRIFKIKGEEYRINARCFHSTMKNFKPPISKTGAISNTPFQSKLIIKIGAKVMLTYNVNTADGLTNGSRGEILGIIKNDSGDIHKLIIKFENPAHGRLQREKDKEVSMKFSGGTTIEKVSFVFSLSKSKKCKIATAKVVQFPIKLAFATTAHKIQGQTVKKPRKVVIDMRSVFQPAMAYVMMSRVESIDQLYILEEFDASKIYGNQQAITELKRMDKIAINQKPSSWNNLQERRTRISILNCGSLRPQLEHIRLDRVLTVSDAICLTETWIWPNEDTTGFNLDGYIAHNNSVGRGKGVTVYYKASKFSHMQDVSDEQIQLSKLSGKNLDIIVVYKAPNGKDQELRDHLFSLIDKNRPTLVCGDFNMCYIDNKNNRSTKFLLVNGFKQLVHEATHINGGHIDHVYLRTDESMNASVELHSPYYTAKDHDALCVSFPETEE